MRTSISWEFPAKRTWNILKFGLDGTACKIYTHLPVDCILCMDIFEFKISPIGAGIVWIHLMLIDFMLNGRNFRSYVFLCAIRWSQYSCMLSAIMWILCGLQVFSIYEHTLYYLHVWICFLLCSFSLMHPLGTNTLGFKCIMLHLSWKFHIFCITVLDTSVHPLVLLWLPLCTWRYDIFTLNCDCGILWHCSDWTFACLPLQYVISWQMFELLCYCTPVLFYNFDHLLFLNYILILHFSALGLYLFY